VVNTKTRQFLRENGPPFTIYALPLAVGTVLYSQLAGPDAWLWWAIPLVGFVLAPLGLGLGVLFIRSVDWAWEKSPTT
jgi:hypothetical protein